MEFRKPGKAKEGGMALIYGEPGVGKTVSTLLTCPKPCLYIECDPKPVERTGEGIVNWDGIEIAQPTDFLDLFYWLSNNTDDIAKRYKSVVLDPFSFLINVILLGDIEDETARAEIFGKNRPLVAMGRTDQSGYGTLASLGKRLCKVLGDISKEGLFIICIALLDDSPKWNRELAGAPGFVGKDFNKNYPAYFDMIGLVESRADSEGNVIYPPYVTFSSPDNSFVHKWSGIRKKGIVRGVLDWSRIIKVSKDNGKNDKGKGGEDE